MKRPLLPILLIVFFCGLLLLRETRTGLLEKPERVLAGWVVSGQGTAVMGLPPTLVLQGGMTGGALSALDIGLFTRAASKLGAGVAAVATYEFPPSQISLDVSSSATRHVGGVILLAQPGEAGVPPVPLQNFATAVSHPENFNGSFSSFPSDRGWSGGFLNLPQRADGGGKVSVAAAINGNWVASFALASLLGGESASLTDEASGKGPTLQVGEKILHLEQDASIFLDAGLIRSLRRLDMDELLLAAERLERGREPSPDILELVQNRILILGTLAEDEEAIRLDSGRRLSMVEFQGVAIASLQAALHPRMVSVYGDLACLFFLCLFAIGLWWVEKIGSVFIVVFAVLAGWVLLVQSFAAQTGFALPMVMPLSLILLAGLLRILMRFHRKLR